MHLNNIKIEKADLPDSFANFFGNKIQDIVHVTQINEGAYNDKRKIFENSSDYNFMSQTAVREAIIIIIIIIIIFF